MPKIKFIADPKPNSGGDFRAGDVVDLPVSSCERWIRRKVAVYAPEPAAATPAPAPEPQPDPPAPESPPAPEPAVAARSMTPAKPRRFGKPSEASDT